MALARLLDGGPLARLRELALGGNPLGGAGAAALADALYGRETGLTSLQVASGFLLST